jgi:hypothetical protein
MRFLYAEFVETFYIRSHKEQKKNLQNEEISLLVSPLKLLNHTIQNLSRKFMLNVLDTSITSASMDTFVKVLP